MKIRIPRPIWFFLLTVVLVIVGVGLHFGVPVYQRNVAIRTIRERGGVVVTGFGGPQWLRRCLGSERMQVFDLAIRTTIGATFTDADLALLTSLPELRSVKVTNAHVTDEGLRYVESLRDLSELELCNTPISDVGLAHVRGIKSLTKVMLSRTRITDAGLDVVQRLRMLEAVELDDSDVGDEGLRYIATLPHLRSLILYKTRVADVGMQHLLGLPELKVLDVRWTNVSEDAVREFKQRKPDVQVLYAPPLLRAKSPAEERGDGRLNEE